MAMLTFAVSADFTVTEFVALICEKVFYLVPYTEEFPVFLTALIDVF